ncbi:MAG: hypothetical protein ABIH82_02400 [Candidatus Woesearchaeota archaeon]
MTIRKAIIGTAVGLAALATVGLGFRNAESNRIGALASELETQTQLYAEDTSDTTQKGVLAGKYRALEKMMNKHDIGCAGTTCVGVSSGAVNRAYGALEAAAGALGYNNN